MGKYEKSVSLLFEQSFETDLLVLSGDSKKVSCELLESSLSQLR